MALNPPVIHSLQPPHVHPLEVPSVRTIMTPTSSWMKIVMNCTKVDGGIMIVT
ncbi:hypothetical protein DPMN_180040 [Dreissena polymorpha]|uniref:Uncharacterized protein n=1 Tax=Dreissena polymorpha TaxID=45954 RepID=A0A9D4EFX1_DREPO|nr:hypothetical protein DPMN_180040 [Dreissena polymorpha]